MANVQQQQIQMQMQQQMQQQHQMQQMQRMHMKASEVPNVASMQAQSQLQMQQQQQQQMLQMQQGHHIKKGNSRYKTELCRAFQEKGFCKYSDKCQVCVRACACLRVCVVCVSCISSFCRLLASLRTELRSCARCSGIQSTRPRCAALSTTRVSARMGLAATLFTRRSRLHHRLPRPRPHPQLAPYHPI